MEEMGRLVTKRLVVLEVRGLDRRRWGRGLGVRFVFLPFSSSIPDDFIPFSSSALDAVLHFAS